MFRFLFKSDRSYDYYLVIFVVLIPLLVGGGFTIYDRTWGHRGRHYVETKAGYELDVPSGWKVMEAEDYTWYKAQARNGHKRGATLFLGRAKKNTADMSDKEKRKLFTEIKKFPKDFEPVVTQHTGMGCEIWTVEHSIPKVDYGETKPYDFLRRRAVIWCEGRPFALLLNTDKATVSDFEEDWLSIIRSLKKTP